MGTWVHLPLEEILFTTESSMAKMLPTAFAVKPKIPEKIILVLDPSVSL
jgi:hypothetical protein